MFGLHKWYLDVVTPSGEAVVVYVAEVSLGGLRRRYGATLVARAGGRAVESVVWGGRPGVPVVKGEVVEVARADLRLQGRWEGTGEPSIAEVLWDDGSGGRVEWRVVLPRALASVVLGGGAARVGGGYVEELNLTLPPWRLPCAALKWGRLLTGGHSVVWIDWGGGKEGEWTWVYLDGRRMRGAAVGEGRVEFSGGRLELPAAGRSVFLDRPLAEAVSSRRWVKLLLPGKLKDAWETKWVSRGTLSLDGVADEPGWALHEVVRFS